MSTEYVAPEYMQNELVTLFHNTPRFGRTSDIAMLTSTNDETPREYTIGAMFITIVLFAVFIACAVTLFSLQCMGPRTVGFWSGDGFVEPKNLNGRQYNRPRRVRIAFIFCCCLVIGFSVLVVLFGLTSVQTTVLSLEDGTLDVHDAVQEGSDIANSLTAVGTTTESVRNEVMIDLGSFCPNANLAEIVGDNIDTDQISDALDSLNDFILGDLESFKENLESVRDATAVVSDALSSYTNFQFRPVYWIPLVAMSAIFVLGTILAWNEASPKAFRCFQGFVLLPTFTVWIICSWLASGAIAVGVVMTSDACSGGAPPGSPAGTIMSVLNTNGVEPNEFLYDAVEYYVEGCRSEDPFLFLGDYRDQLGDAISRSKVFVDGIERFGTEDLSEFCGSDVASTVESLKVLRSSMDVLLENADRTLSLLACDRINPIYVQLFQESACDQGITALSWMMGCLIGISVAGLVMIALRSALFHIRYREPVYYESDEEEDRLETKHRGGVPVANGLALHREQYPIPIPPTPTRSSSKSWEDHQSHERAMSESGHDTPPREKGAVPFAEDTLSSRHYQDDIHSFDDSWGGTEDTEPRRLVPIASLDQDEGEGRSMNELTRKPCDKEPSLHARMMPLETSVEDESPPTPTSEITPSSPSADMKKKEIPPPMDSEAYESLTKSWEVYTPNVSKTPVPFDGEGLLPSVSEDAAIVCNNLDPQTSEV